MITPKGPCRPVKTRSLSLYHFSSSAFVISPPKVRSNPRSLFSILYTFNPFVMFDRRSTRYLCASLQRQDQQTHSPHATCIPKPNLSNCAHCSGSRRYVDIRSLNSPRTTFWHAETDRKRRRFHTLKLPLGNYSASNATI